MSEAIHFPETRTVAAAQLADRYMALWNEPDADRRRRMIAETLDGGRVTDPPAAPGDARDRSEPRYRAGRHTRGAGTLLELEARATASYDHWVGSEGLSFRGRDDAERLGEVVKFHWDAVTNDGETAAVGLNVLVLAADGRIERNYTFVDGA